MIRNNGVKIHTQRGGDMYAEHAERYERGEKHGHGVYHNGTPLRRIYCRCGVNQKYGRKFLPYF